MISMRWIVLGMAVALSGCATALQKKTNETAGVLSREGQEHIAEQREMQEAYLKDEHRLWVGSHPEPMQSGPVLPAVFAQPARLERQVPVTLQMVAEYVSTTFNMPVRVTTDATEAASKNSADPVAQIVGHPETPGAFLLQYTGSLKGLLDLTAARTGNAWRFADGAITLFHYDTRTFFVDALPITSSLEANVSNQAQQGGSGGSGGGGGGGGDAGGGGGSGGGGSSSGGTQVSSGQSASAKGEVEVIQSSADAIKAMLSKGGQIAVSKGTGSITVTDMPDVLDRVAGYVKTLNERLTRQVVMDVRIYQVELNDGENYGINWDVIYQTLNGRYGLTTHSVAEASPGSQSLNLSIIDPTSLFNGTQVLLQALATQGTIAAKTSAGVATISGRPVPLQIADQVYFVNSSGATAVQNVGVQSTLSLGTVTTGTAMNLLPVVLDNNDVLLQVSIDLSSNKGLRKVTSGNATVEAPEIASRQFMQQVKLRSGSTLVMSGFEQESISSDQRGLGSPRFWFAGGGAESTKSHTILLILLTPKVV